MVPYAHYQANEMPPPEYVKQLFAEFIMRDFLVKYLALDLRVRRNQQVLNPITDRWFSPSVVSSLRAITHDFTEIHGNGMQTTVEVSLGRLMDDYYTHLTDENNSTKVEDWGVLPIINSLQKVLIVCNAFLLRESSERGGMRGPRFNILCEEVKDLLIYVSTILDHALIPIQSNFNNFNSEHNNILFSLVISVKPELFWKCFWQDATCFMVYYGQEYEEDRQTENNQHIHLLNFMHVPLQRILNERPEHYRYCRDALQSLLKRPHLMVEGVDQLQRLHSNDSFTEALILTGMQLVPRPSQLSQETLGTMRGIIHRRSDIDVFLPPQLSSRH